MCSCGLGLLLAPDEWQEPVAVAAKNVTPHRFDPTDI